MHDLAGEAIVTLLVHDIGGNGCVRSEGGTSWRSRKWAPTALTKNCQCTVRFFFFFALWSPSCQNTSPAKARTSPISLRSNVHSKLHIGLVAVMGNRIDRLGRLQRPHSRSRTANVLAGLCGICCGHHIGLATSPESVAHQCRTVKLRFVTMTAQRML